MLAGKKNVILNWKEVDWIIKQREKKEYCTCASPQPVHRHMPSQTPMPTESKPTASSPFIVLKILSAPIAIIAVPFTLVVSGVNSALNTIKNRKKQRADQDFSFRTTNIIDKESAYSSIFAPAEVKRESHILVQLYLHLLDVVKLFYPLHK